MQSRRVPIDNLSSIIGKTAIYKCDIPDTIDITSFTELLWDQLPRAVQLDGYLIEEFDIKDNGNIHLEIQLREDYESPQDLIDEYKFLKKRIVMRSRQN